MRLKLVREGPTPTVAPPLPDYPPIPLRIPRAPGEEAQEQGYSILTAGIRRRKRRKRRRGRRSTGGLARMARRGGLAACLFIFVLSSFVIDASEANPDAKRLYDDLISRYNKLVRPVINVSEALTVSIKLKLSQLIEVVSSTLVHINGDLQEG
ncbi:hypothetical protein JTE90_007216 [Oedothorax gibbosus]|uniref:Neurotransmitter-gated ion-channel ligand-binding domain-containing protein n=1 Tax=Oedothorax gibbosus TaxID=931172 RepID=A0AAV6VP16_9ARAC|nr:hypothetical protein JTE90_007216 [Oedothorax gibbosus]